MLPQQLQQPYTSTLRMLWKIDLLRLSVEFKLPTDGTVINLRDHLRVYLNSHSKTLYRNPCYRLLYPQHRCTTLPVAPRKQVEDEPVNRSPSPSTTDTSDTSDSSYESWNGIQGPPLNHIPDVQPPFYPAVPAPAVAHDAANHYPPPPPPLHHPFQVQNRDIFPSMTMMVVHVSLPLLFFFTIPCSPTFMWFSIIPPCVPSSFLTFRLFPSPFLTLYWIISLYI